MRIHYAIVLPVLLGLTIGAASVAAFHAQAAYVITDSDATNMDASIAEQLRLVRKASLDVGAKYLASMRLLGISLGGSGAPAAPAAGSPRDRAR